MCVSHYTSLTLSLDRFIGESCQVRVARILRMLNSLVEAVNMGRSIVEHDLETISPGIIAFDNTDQCRNVGLNLKKRKQYTLCAFNKRLCSFPLAFVFR